MTAVQIAGCSGAGKTTVAAVLARRGLAAIDADDDPLLEYLRRDSGPSSGPCGGGDSTEAQDGQDQLRRPDRGGI